VRAEYDAAREIAEQLLRLAEITQKMDLLVEGHLALGITLVFQGDLYGACAHLEESVRRYDLQ
jgi:predicted oxidoreductase